MSRDITDLLGDLISDSYGGESTETCVPPISTLLAAQDEIVKLRLAASRLDACTWHLIADRKPTIEGRYLVAERVHGAWCEARARWHKDAPGLWKHVEAWLGPLPTIDVERHEP